MFAIIRPALVVGFPSGQREQIVNLPALPSKVRILPPPPFFAVMQSRHRIMAITSAFQADDAGSIPAACSKQFLLSSVGRTADC